MEIKSLSERGSYRYFDEIRFLFNMVAIDRNIISILCDSIHDFYIYIGQRNL